jgi:hypothetical protein
LEADKEVKERAVQEERMLDLSQWLVEKDREKNSKSCYWR